MSNILECSQLGRAELLSIISGEHLALRIPSYYDAKLCVRLTEKIIRADNLRTFKYTTNMQRYGLSLNEMTFAAGGVAEYLERAVSEISEFRAMCAPILTPIDLLRLQLDEIWGAGANLANIGMHKAFTGVARVVRDGGFISPHQDILLSSEVADLAGRVTEQLSANIYLQPSTEGGQLELWNKRMNQAEYQSIRTPGKAGIIRDALPAADAIIHPQQGDLILFRSTHLHAICAASGAPRVTCSSFVGFQGGSKPLVLYC